MEKVKEIIKGEDVAAITAAVEELTQASHALAQHMYEAGQAEGGDGAAAPDAQPGEAQASGDDDEVIDAEFEKKE